jgi:inner membrane protein
MSLTSTDRSPGAKFGLAVLIAILLSLPLFSVWLLVYDRQQQSTEAKMGIAQGWGGPQTIAGPFLVIPYRDKVTETVTQNNRPVVQTREIWRELTLSPETVALETDIRPKPVKRSIYEVVVYDASARGKARFALPADLARLGVAPDALALDRAELRFGVSDARGLGANPRILVGGQRLRLQPGGGPATTQGDGFFALLDAGPLAAAPLSVDYAFEFRGNGRLSLAPQAGDTTWRVTSPWPHPSFQGGFLPAERKVESKGFVASYKIGNLALGQSLASTGPAGSREAAAADRSATVIYDPVLDAQAGNHEARVSLMQPVDLYSQVNRATKYGFLFIGFTFLAFLLFDIIGGVKVSGVEYLLVGVALILFFVLLLAFAEVIGFALAYVVASAAIVGLNTAYSAAVLKSWRRAGFIMTLLGALYVVLYILLSLEAFSLLIGSMMLFLALAALMYLTRNVKWGGRDEAPAWREEPQSA